ncbi:hypothetical protein VE03_10468, partial [Pseudogymnoascus sp. 23342-1-I1]
MVRLETFPVSITDNGSYLFDRVLKSGYVRKRTRKTKSWRVIYLVLRPASIFIYKDEHEAKLRDKILPCDLTAVALYNDPKRKRHNVFRLVSPTRNYLFQALSKPDAKEWVDLIQREARIKEKEEQMLAEMRKSAGRNKSGLDQALQSYLSDIEANFSQLPRARAPDTSLATIHETEEAHGNHTNPERVIWQGRLYIKKFQTKVRRWKSVWCVLRARALAIYKDENEYAPLLILELGSIINVVETDPTSRVKKNCMQVITEGKSYRFRARSQEILTLALGGFK